MEEIFGEIEDEHDEVTEDQDVLVVNDVYTINAKLEVDFLNEKYGLKIPDGDYETIGGFVVANIADIPLSGEVFIIDNYEIKVLAASEQRIELLELRELE